MDNNIQEQLNEATRLCNEGNFKKAEPILRNIVKAEPNHSDAWRLIGQIDLNVNDDEDKAYDELIESLRIDSKNVWALLLMGNLLLKRKDTKTAKQYYSKILAYHPDNAVALNNVATTYADNEEYEDALIYYDKSLKADPTYQTAYYGMAACYFNMGEYRKCFDTCHTGVFKMKYHPVDKGINAKFFSAYVSSAKKLVEQTDFQSIISGIASKLERVDHLDIKFEETGDDSVTAKLEYGPTHGKLYNKVVYNPHKELVPYQFAHELMHLKMMQQDTIVHKGKVLTLTKDNEHAFVHKHYVFIKRTYNNLNEKDRQDLIKQICDGAGTQILNCPLDMFVDLLIYDNYKDLQPIQFLALLTQNEEYAKASSPEVLKLLPKDVANSNRVMNICTSLHLRQLYGISGVGAFHPTKAELSQAEDLYDEFKAYVDSFHPGDEYELVDYFSDSVGMSEYFTLDDEVKYTKAFTDKKSQTDQEHRDDYADYKNAAYSLEHQDGADPKETMMMAMYMEVAMEHCDKLGEEGTKKLAGEIAKIGYHGISPNKQYVLHLVSEKPMDGYVVIAFYYVSFARAFPKILPELSLPYTKAYSMALRMYNKKTGK